jgi:hypothetical protein
VAWVVVELLAVGVVDGEASVVLVVLLALEPEVVVAAEDVDVLRRSALTWLVSVAEVAPVALV